MLLMPKSLSSVETDAGNPGNGHSGATPLEDIAQLDHAPAFEIPFINSKDLQTDYANLIKSIGPIVQRETTGPLGTHKDFAPPDETCG